MRKFFMLLTVLMLLGLGGVAHAEDWITLTTVSTALAGAGTLVGVLVLAVLGVLALIWPAKKLVKFMTHS